MNSNTSEKLRETISEFEQFFADRRSSQVFYEAVRLGLQSEEHERQYWRHVDPSVQHQQGRNDPADALDLYVSPDGRSAPTPEQFVINIIEETKEIAPDVKFETPAFKALEDYKNCREKRFEYKWGCVAALIIAFGSIVIPLARAHTKEGHSGEQK